MKNKNNHHKHIPVLLQEVIDVLDPKIGQRYLDGTAGFGGHALEILARTQAEAETVLIDQDPEAIASLSKLFPKARLIQANFLEAAQGLVDEGAQFDLILLDLGVSSPQIDNPVRGFSFKHDGPLDMRMNTRSELSADEVVNNWPETQLAQVIYEYGEERKSRAVARAIVAGRPFASTAALAATIRGVVGRSGDIDPATRSFQGIRIAVNRELEVLAKVLPLLVELLDTDGRLAVISFHSLEDRIVKQFIERESKDCICPPKQPVCTCDHLATLARITKKPILGKDNDVFNPRARSATLRAVVKLKPKTKE